VAVVLSIKLTSGRLGGAVCAELQLLKGNFMCVGERPIVPFPTVTKAGHCSNPLRPDGGRKKTKTEFRSKNLSFDLI
jgi:hypothetical protein